MIHLKYSIIWLLWTLVSSQKLFDKCDVWAYHDAQCTSSENHRFMWTSCRSSCTEQAAAGIYQSGATGVSKEQCEKWARDGECYKNLEFIQTHCPAECGLSAYWNIYVRNTFHADSMLEMIQEGNSRKEVGQVPISFKDNTHRDKMEAYKRQIAKLRPAAATEKRNRRLSSKSSSGQGFASSAIDLESMSVVPNPSTSNADLTTRLPDIFEIAEEMRARLWLVSHDGSMDPREHLLNFDTPAALQGIYGLYEGAYYTLRMYQVTVTLLSQGVIEWNRRGVEVIKSLHESLSLMKTHLRQKEMVLNEVLVHDGYSGEYMSRNFYQVVMMLSEIALSIEDIMLHYSQLPSFITSGGLLNLSRLQEGMSAHLSESGFVRRNRDAYQKELSNTKAPMPKLLIGKRSEGGATVILSTGVSMPALAFGTWKLDRGACELGVMDAIENGIRHIDSAEAYMNERFTGNGIQNALDSVPGLSREDLFIATKLSNQDTSGGYENTLALINRQMHQLRVDYLDLYYLHSPFRDRDVLLGSLRAIFRMIFEGKIRCFGLSNFGPKDLDYFYNSIYDNAVKIAIEEATVGANLVQKRMVLLRPVVLQNKFDFYHSGRQFDNEGTDIKTAAVQMHSLFLMGYSPFSGYPFALMPLHDPALAVLSSAYYESPEAAAWNSLCSSIVNDIVCGNKTEKGAFLVQYMLKSESVGIILRSQSRTNLFTSVFAASSEMAPLSSSAVETLRTIQELISNPYLQSIVYTK